MDAGESASAVAMPTFDFTDKRVLITGGGAGIGRATALAFARCDARVIVVEKLPDLAEQVSSDLRDIADHHQVIIADVTELETAAKVASTLAASGTGLDVLVNNVGDFLKLRPFESTSDDDIDRLYAVNLRHIFTMTRACIPLLRQRAPGASIVSVSSIEGFRAMPDGAVYGAFKAAITGFTQSLALELGPGGIRVNLIAPETTASRQVPLDKIVREDRRSLVPFWIPQGRFGVPEDHANSILFLASPLAEWITGTAIHVDGGSHAAGGWYRTPAGRFTNMPSL